MKSVIYNQIMGAIIVIIMFITSTIFAFITKKIDFIIISIFLGILSLLFTLSAIKVIKKEKGIKNKHDFNYGLCIGFICLTAFFITSLIVFINNISYRINGIETTSTIYKITKRKEYKTEYDEENSYEVEEEICNNYVKYTVNNKEYKSKITSQNCNYSKGDKVKIYYDKSNPNRIESNSIYIPLIALILSVIGLLIFIIKYIKSYSKKITRRKHK